jgi:hypothetical protein
MTTTTTIRNENQYHRGKNNSSDARVISHANMGETVSKSAQTSFFREDPFVSVTRNDETREREKKRGKSESKKKEKKNEATIARSKNGRVLISAANIVTDESDVDFSESTTAEYDSEDDDHEIEEEQIRLTKRLDAIKVRLKKLGIS